MTTLRVLDRYLSIDAGGPLGEAYVRHLFAPMVVRDGSAVLRSERRCLHVSREDPLRDVFEQGSELVADVLRSAQDHLGIYGASLAFPSGAAVLVGDARSGKTTIALEAASHGAKFMGDETAIVDRLGIVRPLGRSIMIREDALALLSDASLPTRARRHALISGGANARAYHVPAPQLFDSVADQAPLRAIVRIERAESTTVHRQSLARFLCNGPRCFYLDPQRNDDFTHVLRFFDGVRAYVLRGADPTTSAHALRDVAATW